MWINHPRLVSRGWNERTWSHDDFLQFCESDGVFLFYVAMKCRGVFVPFLDSSVIFINRSLQGERKLIVEFKEFAHAVFYDPAAPPDPCVRAMVQFQSDAVSACARIPRPVALRSTPARMNRSRKFSDTLIRFRYRLLDDFDI